MLEHQRIKLYNRTIQMLKLSSISISKVEKIIPELTFASTSKQSHLSNTLITLPSLMDARSFTAHVHRCGLKLSTILEQEYLHTYQNERLLSKATVAYSREKANEECKALCTLRQVDVEDIVLNKYKLCNERLATCLVPYQVGVNIILSKLPPCIRDACVCELKNEEEAIKLKRETLPHKWIQWFEKDLYVKDGLRYLRNINAHARPRTPIFSVMGHINHGKSTLLEVLTQTNIRSWESSNITQNVRTFTVCGPNKSSKQFTFIDTPGHRVFVETRFHMQLICDYVLLVISIVDGVEGQVYEIIKTALNLDKPIVVVFTKMDLLRGSLKAAERVRELVLSLREIGLDVTMIHNKAELDTLLGLSNTKEPISTKCHHDNNTNLIKVSDQEVHLDSEHVLQKNFTVAQTFLAPVRYFDSTFSGSRRHPRLDLSRKCVGVCVSALRGTRCSLLWDVLYAIQVHAEAQVTWHSNINTSSSSFTNSNNNNSIASSSSNYTCSSSHSTPMQSEECSSHPSWPVCWSHSANWHESNAAVQAIVVEASKHLFDEDNFRCNNRKQRLQRAMDRAQARKRQKFNLLNVPDRVHAMHEVHSRRARRVNRTSTSTLVISAIVTEGAITPGMHFVADQADGCVEYLLDHTGQELTTARPGTAVTIIDTHSASGLPWPGIHILSTVDYDIRNAIHCYRQQLQWFVELFPHHLHYLRPRGMDVTFAHLGDYGQLQITDSLEAQLVYGLSAKEQAARQQALREGAAVVVPVSPMASLGEAQYTSLAAYLADKNEQSEVLEHQELLGKPAKYYTPATLTSTTTNSSKTNNIKPFAHTIIPSESSSSSSSSSSFCESSSVPLDLSVVNTTCTNYANSQKRTSQNIMTADEASALETVWQGRQLQHQPESQEEYKRLTESCIQVGVLLFVDNWHSGRMFTRMVEQLGTQRIRFNVLGVRFGQPSVDELRFFGFMVKLILCYRVPRNNLVEVDDYVSMMQQWMLEANHFADVITFCKWCAITLETDEQTSCHISNNNNNNNNTNRSNQNWMRTLERDNENANEKRECNNLPKQTSHSYLALDSTHHGKTSETCEQLANHNARKSFATRGTANTDAGGSTRKHKLLLYRPQHNNDEDEM